MSAVYDGAVQEVRDAIGAPVAGGSIAEMIADLKRQYEGAYEDAVKDIRLSGRKAVNTVEDTKSDYPDSANVLNLVIFKLQKAFGLFETLKEELRQERLVIDELPPSAADAYADYVL